MLQVRLLLLLIGLALILSGCAPAGCNMWKGCYELPPGPIAGSKAMQNCQQHLAVQQRHNNLSPLCYCEWQEDSEFNERRGTFPKRYTNETVVRCDTCDPFQQGIECGDIPPPSTDHPDALFHPAL